MSWIVDNGASIWAIVSGVVTVASVIVRLTPGKADDAAVGKVARFLELLALNKRK